MEGVGVRGALVAGGLAVVATIAVGALGHRLVLMRSRASQESHALAA
jgi:hypothetical protein